MNHNYIRPGGVAVDMPDGWREHLGPLLDVLPERLEEFDVLMTGQPICVNGSRASARSPPKRRSAWVPPARCCALTGYAWDLRRDMPYLRYDQVDFDVVVGTHGDSF